MEGKYGMAPERMIGTGISKIKCKWHDDAVEYRKKPRETGKERQRQILNRDKS